MVCPYCGTKNMPQAAVCAHCGAILRGEAAAKQGSKRPLKPSRLWRMAAIAVAALVGAVVGALLVRFYDPLLPLPDGILPGAVIGAALVYLVSGGKTLYLTNLYRARLAGLQRRIGGTLSAAQDRYEGDLKKEVDVPQTRLKLAVLQLLQDEIEKSVQTFQQAQRLGVVGADFDNNAGVALARRGSLTQSLEMFQRAVGRNGSSSQPHANLAHALVSVGGEAAASEQAVQEARRIVALDAQNPASYNRLGVALCLEGQPGEAEAQFGQALKLAGGSRSAQADARCNLGVARFLNSHGREASREFGAALGADPGHARALANQGLLLLLNGEIESGLERIQNAALLDPRSADIQAVLGYAYCRTENVNDGIRASHSALALNANLFEPCYNMGKAYADAGLSDIAERYLTRACQMRPQSWEALMTLGVVKVALGQPSQAIQSFQSASYLIQNQPLILLNLALALGLNGQHKEAELYLQQINRLDPDNVDVYAAMGWLHLLRDSPSAAAGEITIALEKDEKNAIQHNNMGLAQAGMGANDVAQIHLRRALALDSELHQPHYNLGCVYATLKRLDNAIREWEAASKYELTNPDCFVNLGVAYYRKGNFDDAVAQFRRALQIRTDKPDDYSNLGLSYAKQGVILRDASRNMQQGLAMIARGAGAAQEKEKQAIEKQKQAIDMFDRALGIQPRNVMLHSNRGLACFFANRPEEAMTEWGLVTQIDPNYARRRGKAVQSEFDDTQVDFVPLDIPKRAVMPPLQTADYQYQLLWSYDTDDWEMIISDPPLAPLPKMTREAHSLERNLRAPEALKDHCKFGHD